MIYTKIAIPKGRLGQNCIKVFFDNNLCSIEKDEFDRKLIIEDKENKIKFLLAKPTDIPYLVANGYADIGIAGKDTIYEYGNEKFTEIYDLEFGKCKLSVAGIKNNKGEYLFKNKIKVATKYPKIAKKFFESIGKKASFIKLNGCLEMCPNTGMADVIVDIVQTR